MNAQLDRLEISDAGCVAAGGPCAAASEAAWDVWVEEICAEVAEHTLLPRPGISFADYVRLCLWEE